ncbi:MAG: helix-hairpin-helix domain-containing protein [Burkholderiales bacterium]|nr:helix-hairpin-helix domain-containing protein [Burkholderiales bacterium]
MKSSIFQTAFLAAALILLPGLSLAATDKAPAAGEPKAATKAKAAEKGDKAKGSKAAAKIKLVDINSAGKAELKSLPGISDADADKIIAGRPYLSKANLATHNIISREVYDALKTRVIAKQNKATEAKVKEKQQEKQKAR